MLAETCDRCPGRDGTVSTAGHEQLVARSEFDRLRRAARVPQFLAAAGRTLRAKGDVMLRDGGAQQVQADNVITQFSAKVGGNRFCDFERS